MEHDYNTAADPRHYMIAGRSFFPPEFMVNPYPRSFGMAPNCGGSVLDVGDAGMGRWRTQETLSLLEVRTRLDSKFREANHRKAPLWEEVSRIMLEEYGYQRSGKKCREKLENLYKYYKKTRLDNTRRQDGKHYKFFGQLDALYGEANKSVSMEFGYFNNDIYMGMNQEPYPGHKSNYCDLVEISSGWNDVQKQRLDQKGKKRRVKKSIESKIMSFIDEQMTNVIEKQEIWMEKVVKTIEKRDLERMLREEEWRKQDAARIEREHTFWANEKSWIEARDTALMEAFHQAASKQYSGTGNPEKWSEYEMCRLIQVRSGMKFGGENGVLSAEELWEEVARRMASFGHHRSGLIWKEKWDQYVSLESKKSKENYCDDPGTSSYYENLEGVYCDKGIENMRRQWGSGF